MILRVMGSKENLLRKLFPQQLQQRKIGTAGFPRGTGAKPALRPRVPFVSSLYHPACGSCFQEGLPLSMGRTDTINVTIIPKATVPRAPGHKGTHVNNPGWIFHSRAAALTPQLCLSQGSHISSVAAPKHQVPLPEEIYTLRASISLCKTQMILTASSL